MSAEAYYPFWDSTIGVASSPTLDALKPEQKQVLAEMRARLTELEATKGIPCRHDLWLKRFAQQAKWKLEEALDNYLAMEAWRQENNVDKLLQDDPEGRMLPTLPLSIDTWLPYSTDKIGRMVAVMQLGITPWWKSLFETADELCQSQMWIAENNMRWGARNAAETGVWRERYVVLLDMGKLDWEWLQGVVCSTRAQKRTYRPEFTAHYPGIIDMAYILNAPTFVNKVLGILKMILSPALLEKAAVVSSATEIAAMLEDLGPENVPQCFGGSCDAPSIAFPEHLRNQQMPAPGSWDETLATWCPREVTIAARATHEELLSVPAGRCARWHWALVDHTITFEVAQRPENSESFETVSEKQELDFSKVEQDPVIGQMTAPSGGCVLRFLWDNTFSKMRSKTLLLKLEVLQEAVEDVAVEG